MTAAMAVTGGAESYVAECAERFSRSQIIAWLVQHHDSVAKATARRILRWDDLAQRLFHDGIRTLQGQAPSGPSLRVTWYRVRKLIAAQREKAKAAAEREALEQAEMEAQREAARANKARRAAEDARLREKIGVVQENAAWQREQDRRRREEQERAAAQRAAARVTAAAKAADVAAPPAEGSGHPVMLDLPRIEGVSYRAYLPHDPTLPPVREGDICRATGNAWEVGDDLPGYPSKRNYEREIDWLRDVGQLLRAKHPTNLTMTRQEKWAIRTAEASIPNLYR